MRYADHVKLSGGNGASKNMAAANKSFTDYAVSPSHGSSNSNNGKEAQGLGDGAAMAKRSSHNDVSKFSAGIQKGGGQYKSTPAANSLEYQDSNTKAKSAPKALPGKSKAAMKVSDARGLDKVARRHSK